jgi:4-amino-4-deoxy-L-arabinose transferase-like glycosyltransferase
MLAIATLAVAVLYVPFMAGPMLRTTGDEKVYIAQALEMASAGSWFKQTLGEIPSYYKGPAHYVLLRTGFLLFGATSPLAFVFMNAIAAVVAAAATGYAVYRWRARNHRDAVTVGAITCGMMALNTGLFSHAHASQMEAELIAVYAVMTAIMVGAAKDAQSHPYAWHTDVRQDYWLWIMAGIAGWFKSPIYSVLTGTSILVWWSMSGQLVRKLRDIRVWQAMLLGVATGILAYLPAIVADWEVFQRTFIHRENLAKGGNEHSWIESLVPLATVFLFPFWAICATSFASKFIELTGLAPGQRPSGRAVHRGPGLPCAAMILPTLVFFAAFPFRSHIYYLPVIPAIYVWASDRFFGLPPTWFAIRRFFLVVEWLLLGVVLGGLVAFLWWMPSAPDWMPSLNLMLVTCGAGAAIVLTGLACRAKDAVGVARYRLAGAAFMTVSISLVMIAIGKADVLDVKRYLDRRATGSDRLEVLFVDKVRHTWSEWGLLNGLLGREVRAVRDSGAIADAIQRGAVVLVSREEDLAAIKSRFEADRGVRGTSDTLLVTEWQRWNTHGRDKSGKSGLREALFSRSWNVLRRTSWIVQKRGTITPASQASIHHGKTNIILLTWDGVRPQEFFSGKPGRTLLPYFWTQLAPRGIVLGDGPQITTIANGVVMSLPAYQSILSGQAQWCFSNECGGVTDQTISDRLVFQEGMAPEKVATVASWSLIGSAATSSAGSGFVSAGSDPVPGGEADPVIAEINRQQASERPPWANARYDKFTHRLALHWLKKHQPRFMHISLNDTDEYGHRGEFEKYVGALRANDHRLRELVDILAESGEYGKNTCIVMTTDHGRGIGSQWTRHSNGQPLAARIWMYFGCPFSSTPPRLFPDTDLVTHLDIRPTIEASLGMEPRPCRFCGEPVTRLDPTATVFALGGN